MIVIERDECQFEQAHLRTPERRKFTGTADGAKS